MFGVGAPVASDFRKIAILETDGPGRPLRQEPAMPAWFAGETQGAALRAFEQARGGILAACCMFRVGRAKVRIQRPGYRVLDEPMSEHGAAVVEHDGVNLARSRPQHAADHLPEQAHLLRRTREDAAADLGHVPALGQHHAVGNELDLAGRQPRERGIAFGLGCCSVDVLGANAGLDEFIAQMDRMRDVDREGHRLAALAELVPVRDDIADQLRPIHAIGELRLDVIAGLGANTGEIGIDRRIDAGLDQESLLDQRRDLRALDDGLEDAAEPAAIASAWRCGQAQQDRLRDSLR